MKTENFTEELHDVQGIKIRVITYQIGNEHYCHVYNLDPGAVIARAGSSTKDLAKQRALQKAKQRLLSATGNH